MPANIIHVEGRPVEVVSEEMVEREYLRKFRRYGVEVEEWVVLRYVAVTVRDYGRAVEA